MDAIRSLIAGFALAAAAVAPAAAVDKYPSKPVVLMVPYPAGGLSDAIARSFNQRLGKALQQPVVVENLGGVSGAIAAQKVLAAPADGHMIFLGSPNEVILSPLSNAAVKLRSEDFVMLGKVTVNPLVMVARADLPARTVDELAALGRQPSTKSLSYGTVGPGSMYHLVTEDMARRVGIGVTHVPYKGMAPLIQDLVGKNIDFAILPYSTTFRGLADQGRIKLVGWASDERSKLDPAIPAFGEGRVLKGFEQATWSGIMVRHDTPPQVVAILKQALRQTLQDPQVRTAIEATGAEVAGIEGFDEAQRFYQAEIARFRGMAGRIDLQRQ